MCNQTVVLVAAELERRGIATAAIQLLREVAPKVCPPRSLFVTIRHGYPLERPLDPKRQLVVLEAALSVLQDEALRPAVMVEFEER